MTAEAWTVRLDIPCDVRFLHIVRLTAAGAGTEAGLDTTEVEDVKIAVDELCSIAIASATPDASLAMEFRVGPGRLRIEASLPTAYALAVDAMGRAILDATVDTFDFHDHDRGGFHLIKSHRGR